MMGIIEFGFLYNNILTVQFAARQGASAAAEAGPWTGRTARSSRPSRPPSPRRSTRRGSPASTSSRPTRTGPDARRDQPLHPAGTLDCPGGRPSRTRSSGAEGYPQTDRHDSLADGLDIVGVRTATPTSASRPSAPGGHGRCRTGRPYAWSRSSDPPSAAAAPGAAAERGQSLVEFTLILPVFLLVLMGMLEFGSASTTGPRWPMPPAKAPGSERARQRRVLPRTCRRDDRGRRPARTDRPDPHREHRLDRHLQGGRGGQAGDRQHRHVRPRREPDRHGRLAGQRRGSGRDQRRLDRRPGPLRLPPDDAARRPCSASSSAATRRTRRSRWRTRPSMHLEPTP